MPLAAGFPAPDFELPDDTNTPRRLSDFRGHTVLLYFYPADHTAGCTAEACSFRDDYSAYEAADVVILGVSPDDVASHAKFKADYDLPFHLLADKGHEVCDLYKVWGPKKKGDREYEGVYRTTYLIDEAGIIARVFENVQPDIHSAELLRSLQVRY